MHEEGAVATNRDARPIGRSELRAEDAGDPESHWAEAHRADKGIRPSRIAELDQPIVMDADVTHQDGIGRQSLVDLVGGALRVDRTAVVAASGRDERIPLLAIGLDRGEPL